MRVMRRWGMAAVVAAAVVALAVVGIASRNLSRFVAANRPRLETTLRAQLGRPVTTGPVELSLLGPGVRVRDVRVADDPRFGGEVLRAEHVIVTVRLLPALLGRYVIRSIRVDAPVVTLVRDEIGWNVAPAPPPESARTSATPAPETPSRGPLVLPWPCTVSDGTIRVIDRRVTPARELVLEDVEGSVSAATRDRPI